MSCGRRVPNFEQDLLCKKEVKIPWAQTILIACGHCLALRSIPSRPDDDLAVIKHRVNFFPQYGGYCLHYIFNICNQPNAKDMKKDIKSLANYTGNQLKLFQRANDDCYKIVINWLDSLKSYVESGKWIPEVEKSLKQDYKTLCYTAFDKTTIKYCVAFDWYPMLGNLDSETLQHIKNYLTTEWESISKIRGKEPSENIVKRANEWLKLSLALSVTARASPQSFAWASIREQYKPGQSSALIDNCYRYLDAAVQAQSDQATEMRKLLASTIQSAQHRTLPSAITTHTYSEVTPHATDSASDVDYHSPLYTDTPSEWTGARRHPSQASIYPPQQLYTLTPSGQTVASRQPSQASIYPPQQLYTDTPSGQTVASRQPSKAPGHQQPLGSRVGASTAPPGPPPKPSRSHPPVSGSSTSASTLSLHATAGVQIPNYLTVYPPQSVPNENPRRRNNQQLSVFSPHKSGSIDPRRHSEYFSSRNAVPPPSSHSYYSESGGTKTSTSSSVTSQVTQRKQLPYVKGRFSGMTGTLGSFILPLSSSSKQGSH